jgi:hypothetical protein
MNHLDVKNIKAETLVSLSDIREDFNVHAKSIFSRNYGEDLIEIENEKDKTTIALSRNGIFDLLPQGLFFQESQLKVKHHEFEKKYNEFKKQKKEALSFFRPFDTTYFKLNLELEQKINHLAETGNDIFMDADPEKSAANNPYISKIKKLIPHASQIRGNIALLVDILKNITDAEKVELKKDTRFIIHKENLTKEEYHAMDKELEPFFDFFTHWFLPVEQQYGYRIKDNKQPFKLGNSLILDYNTHL